MTHTTTATPLQKILIQIEEKTTRYQSIINGRDGASEPPKEEYANRLQGWINALGYFKGHLMINRLDDGGIEITREHIQSLKNIQREIQKDIDKYTPIATGDKSDTTLYTPRERDILLGTVQGLNHALRLFEENGLDATRLELEDGIAEITISLRGGAITIIHSDGTILHQVMNAPKGSWDKVWGAIKRIKSI